jgi:hypothetical protein
MNNDEEITEIELIDADEYEAWSKQFWSGQNVEQD